jgi:hypothetical protein
MLHYETVSPGLLEVLRQLMQLPELKNFRLVGGTSLALQIGHRKSVDIDLFCSGSFDTVSLHRKLAAEFDSFELNWENKNGFTSSINNIKVDLFNWNVPFTTPPVTESELVLMHEEEIGAMKLETVTSRKEKKDFIDIAILLQKYSLSQLLIAFKTKYPYMNAKFVLESLMAIDYADETAEPVMMNPFSWADTKSFIISAVETYFETKKKEIELQQQERLRKAEELLKNKKKNS